MLLNVFARSIFIFDIPKMSPTFQQICVVVCVSMFHVFCNCLVRYVSQLVRSTSPHPLPSQLVSPKLFTPEFPATCLSLQLPICPLLPSYPLILMPIWILQPTSYVNLYSPSQFFQECPCQLPCTLQVICLSLVYSPLAVMSSTHLPKFSLIAYS